MKTNVKMSFNEAKEFYLGQNHTEKEFIDVMTLYGLENKPEVIIHIKLISWLMTLLITGFRACSNNENFIFEGGRL